MSDNSKPAFPGTVESVYVKTGRDGKPEKMTEQVPGMTLREYYAGLAMQGLLSFELDDFEIVALNAVNFADSLIDALQEAGNG